MQLDDFRQLYKEDLHRHFDGSLRYTTLLRVLKEQKISCPAIKNVADLTLDQLKKLIIAEGSKDLVEYLKAFDITCAAMQTEENLRLFADECVEDAKNDNLVHLEIRYAPKQHTHQGLSLEKVHQIVDDAFYHAGKKYQVSVSLIICAMKQWKSQDQDELLGLFELKNKLPLYYDQAGPETGFTKFNEFSQHFDYLNKNKIRYTLHAGEAGDGENVLLAIQSGAYRIGHGTRAQENQQAISEASKGKILFEMCPTSNSQTHVVGINENLEDYPIVKYLESGIPCCICCDNTAMSDCTSSGEYFKLYQSLKLTPAQILLITVLGIKYSFCKDESKNELLEKVLQHNTKILEKFDSKVFEKFQELYKHYE